MQSLADTGVFPGDAKNIYELLGSTDKSLELMAGDHYLLEPHDARDNYADKIASWLGARLGSLVVNNRARPDKGCGAERSCCSTARNYKSPAFLSGERCYRG